ncbi:MAG: hypothetical protein IK066_00880 [Kiritimatiellae bacterium]|nr:hypothetical protein [Kiritimatiellia bacterium]
MNTNSPLRPSVRLSLFAAASLLLFAFASGCEHDPVGERNGSSSSSSESSASASSAAVSSSAIVGSWRLVSGDGAAWYAHFDENGNWKITDDAEGTARRVYGTYTFDGTKFSGPMVNPHVGEGKIEGTLEDGSMTLDFVEYWHTPAKHVPYSGTKL